MSQVSQLVLDLLREDIFACNLGMLLGMSHLYDKR